MTLNLSSQILLDLSHIKFFNQLKIIIILFIEEKNILLLHFIFLFFLFSIKSIDANLWEKMTRISRAIYCCFPERREFIYHRILFDCSHEHGFIESNKVYDVLGFRSS